MSDNYCVYWIRRESHIDVMIQGYVGITNNVLKRMKQHRSGKTRVGAAMRKYDDVVYDILHDNVSISVAKQIEQTLRPSKHLGWNLAEGGGLPPSIAGRKRPAHSELMRGEGNPFYGKNHTEATKTLLSENKSGTKHPFYGKKRECHSNKMKLKRGDRYPKFRGYFITPLGEYASYEDVSRVTGLSPASIYKYCINENDSRITALSYSKTPFIKDMWDKSVVGKTYHDIGFGFRHV